MVLVELVVPALGQRYDFDLDEKVRVEVLLPEMAEIIAQKEHCTFGNTIEQMSLYSVTRQCRLAMDVTVYQNGVIHGEKLMLL